MAVTTTALGTNSWQLDYTSGTTVTQLSEAINAVMLLGGWTVYDASAGTNAVCYRAPNKDGTTFKYAVIDYNTAGVLLVKCYESWNASTHVGTNLAYNSNVATYAGKYSTSAAGQVFAFITPRWAAFATRDPATAQLNNHASWQGLFGLFEIARDNPEDTPEAGYPPVVWMNTNMMYANSSHNCCGFMPRTRSGATAATALTEVACILGKTRSGSSIKMGQFMPTGVNPWNAKDWALTAYLHEPSNVIRGRIYGLKFFTQSKNLFMDKAEVSVDSDFFYNVSGAAHDHFVIINGSYGSAAGRILIPS